MNNDYENVVSRMNAAEKNAEYFRGRANSADVMLRELYAFRSMFAQNMKSILDKLIVIDMKISRNKSKKRKKK